MKIRFDKPEIAAAAADQGKRRTLTAEIWIFIGVFLIGSLLAGIIPSVYDIYVMFSDEDTFDALSEIMLNSQNVFSDMMDFVLHMSDAMYVLTLLCTIIVILTAVIYCTRIEHRSMYSMGFVKDKAFRHYGAGILVGLMSFSLCFLLGVITGVLHVQGINKECNPLIVLLYIIGFMIQGMSEEVMFRGYFMVSIMKKNSLAKAVFINSFAFALCHILNPGLSVLAFINLMLIGIFLSMYVIYTNDIWGAAAYHFMWNFAQGTLYGVSVSGTSVSGAILQTATDDKLAILSGGAFGMEGSIFTTVIMGLALIGMVVINQKKRRAD